jgi:purine-binding chemotaxis protein CheW
MAAQATLQTAAAGQKTGTYLTFMLADEQYGIEISKVIEIVGMMETTAVPRMPRFVKGVVNLRGKIVPVVDLRLQLGMPENEHASRRCMIVVALQGGESGILVDKVLEVLNISAADVDETPALAGDVNAEFILGLAKSESRITILLDIARLLKEASPTQHAEV